MCACVCMCVRVCVSEWERESVCVRARAHVLFHTRQTVQNSYGFGFHLAEVTTRNLL